jgi:ankyrin repeat-rich membrane spanning protein
MEPMLEMDRDEKKLDVFLSLHKKSLTVANMKIFLPFTINLDPYIKKVIKDEVQNLEELGLHILSAAASPLAGHLPATNAPLTRRQAVGLSKRLTAAGPDGGLVHSQVPYPSMPSFMTAGPPLLSGQGGWPPATAYGHHHQPSSAQPGGYPLYPPPATFHHLNLQHVMMGRQQKTTSRPLLPAELQGLVLSALSVDQVCVLVRGIEHINLTMLDTYCATIAYNNITGRVLLHCQLDELRNVLNMNFGDWELFKILLAAMREDELLGGAVQHHHAMHGEHHHERQYQSDDDLYDPAEAMRRRAESAGKGRKPSSVERQVLGSTCSFCTASIIQCQHCRAASFFCASGCDLNKASQTNKS